MGDLYVPAVNLPGCKACFSLDRGSSSSTMSAGVAPMVREWPMPCNLSRGRQQSNQRRRPWQPVGQFMHRLMRGSHNSTVKVFVQVLKGSNIGWIFVPPVRCSIWSTSWRLHAYTMEACWPVGDGYKGHIFAPEAGEMKWIVAVAGGFFFRVLAKSRRHGF